MNPYATPNLIADEQPVTRPVRISNPARFLLMPIGCLSSLFAVLALPQAATYFLPTLLVSSLLILFGASAILLARLPYTRACKRFTLTWFFLAICGLATTWTVDPPYGELDSALAFLTVASVLGVGLLAALFRPRSGGVE